MVAASMRPTSLRVLRTTTPTMKARVRAMSATRATRARRSGANACAAGTWTTSAQSLAESQAMERR